jgi:hypothetical protein
MLTFVLAARQTLAAVTVLLASKETVSDCSRQETTRPAKTRANEAESKLSWFRATLTPLLGVLEWESGAAARVYPKAAPPVVLTSWFSLFAKAAAMALETKSTRSRVNKQIALTVLVMVALVAGITFVAQYQGMQPVITGVDKPPVGPGSNPKDSNIKLTFPVVVWGSELQPQDPRTRDQKVWGLEPQLELRTSGHHDFWFQNENNVPVDVGIEHKNCKCSSIHVCVLTSEERERYVRWACGAAVFPLSQLTRFGRDLAVASFGLQGMLDDVENSNPELEAGRGFKLNWQQLKKDEDRVTVPAKAFGMVRLGWDGREKDKFGPERLAATLWTQVHQDGSAPRGEEKPKLEVVVNFTTPLQLSPNSADVENLNFGKSKTAEFLCISQTRAAFPLTVHEKSGDPCVTCRWWPLSEEECFGLETDAKLPRVLSGYRVRVTVHERVAETRQMELGPFVRNIIFSSPVNPEDGVATITGRVMGDLTIGTDDDKGKVRLGPFPVTQGGHKAVLIVAERPGIELKPEYVRIEPASLSYIKFSLKSEPAVEGKARWRLHVTVPPNGLSGRLPEDAALLIRLTGEPPRSVRIPITGTAYQQ